MQPSLPGFEEAKPAANVAVFSPDGKYRYLLTREGLGGVLGSTLTVMSIGLNPSTATADKNDPTIRREIGFAQRAGFGRFVKTNLYGLVSPYPGDLLAVEDPVGENDAAILNAARSSDMVIAAWGTWPKLKRIFPARVAHVVAMLKNAGITLMSYGSNKDGSPKHPLYLPNTTEIVPWTT